MNKNITMFYFSGTGNTRLVAEAAKEEFISQGYNCILKELTRGVSAQDLPESEMLGIAFPVFGLMIPGIVKDFLKDLPGNKDGKCFIIANAHSNSGLSIKQAEKLLCKKGYSLAGAVSTHTPSSSIITEDTEPELKAEEMRKTAVKKVQQFVGDLVTGKAAVETANVSFKEKMVSILFKFAMPGPVVKSAHVNRNCTGCGLCESSCPAGNIKLNNGKPSWGKACEVCMRCINLCPNNAIEMMQSAGRIRYKGGLV